jgi:hypothetical protein
MPSDARAHSSNQEALLDQALDAIKQRLRSFHQSPVIAHKPQQVRSSLIYIGSGLIHIVRRERERDVDFLTEYQRLSNEAFDALGARPALTVEAAKAATDSAADPPPPQGDAHRQTPAGPGLRAEYADLLIKAGRPDQALKVLKAGI